MLGRAFPLMASMASQVHLRVGNLDDLRDLLERSGRHAGQARRDGQSSSKRTTCSVGEHRRQLTRCRHHPLMKLSRGGDMQMIRRALPIACFLWPLIAHAAAKPDFDLVLSNGRVVDGSGAPWFRADVGIRGDRIVAIGDLSRRTTARRIDVQNRMVAPGFIDLLGQSQLYVLIDNRVESKIRQGITTEITGEGTSVAPVSQAALSQASAFLDRYRLKIDWKDLDGYIKRFESTRSAINLGTFVGAAQVRIAVLGLADVQHKPAHIAQMETLVEQAMKQGARGVSTALIYPPGSYAKTAELIALAKVAARYGGVYASHIRGEADTELEAVEEALTIRREARIPVEIWDLKVAGRSNWGKMKGLLERIERARSEGIDVAANMYPYQAAT